MTPREVAEGIVRAAECWSHAIGLIEAAITREREANEAVKTRNVLLQRAIENTVAKLEKLEADYQRIITAVLECDPIGASQRVDDQLEPPWDVIRRTKQRAERAEAVVAAARGLMNNLKGHFLDAKFVPVWEKLRDALATYDRTTKDREPFPGDEANHVTNIAATMNVNPGGFQCGKPFYHWITMPEGYPKPISGPWHCEHPRNHEGPCGSITPTQEGGDASVTDEGLPPVALVPGHDGTSPGLSATRAQAASPAAQSPAVGMDPMAGGGPATAPVNPDDGQGARVDLPHGVAWVRAADGQQEAVPYYADVCDLAARVAELGDRLANINESIATIERRIDTNFWADLSLADACNRSAAEKYDGIIMDTWLKGTEARLDALEAWQRSQPSAGHYAADAEWDASVSARLKRLEQRAGLPPIDPD